MHHKVCPNVMIIKNLARSLRCDGGVWAAAAMGRSLKEHPRRRGALAACCAFLLFHGASSAPLEKVVAPVERAGFSILTSHDSLQAFLRLLATRPEVTLRQIAHSGQGRSVDAVFISSSASPSPDRSRLRVLLFAQQHGDEPSGKEALTMLAAGLVSGAIDTVLEEMDLVLAPQMNPDGAELRQRWTADSLDQNRSHLLLSTPEVRGLHELFQRWSPHVTVDVHEYNAFSKSWVEAGIIRAADVQLGLLTNPNVPERLRAFQSREILPAVAAGMERNGYSFHEYIVGSPQSRIRHSTTEINDGRQSFGILATLSFIQEGRQEETLEKNLERRVRSQLTALEALLDVCARRAREIQHLVENERARGASRIGEPFATVMEHVAGPHTLHVPVFDAGRGEKTLWQVTPYHGEVTVLSREILPVGYVIPDSLKDLRDLLQAHGSKLTAVVTEERRQAGLYVLDTLWTEELEEQPHLRVGYRLRDTTVTISFGHWIIPLDQAGALMIASILEPASIWGVSRYERFAQLYQQRIFPIIRLGASPRR